jgi:hypothetical protein
MQADEQDGPLDLGSAADLLRQTEQASREALTVRMSLVYAAWGVAWLAGLVGMWLSVRAQHPYQGPSGLSAAVFGVLLVVALTVTVVAVMRASRGVRGGRAARGQMVGWSWPVGFGVLFAIDGALRHAGASPAVTGLVGLAGPAFVVSLIYVVGAAVSLDWVMFGLGVWLAAVAVAGAWSGPVHGLLVVAVASAAGFFTAALLARRDTA